MKKQPTSIRQAAPDPYTVLGLERKAGLADIKRAYFTLVREFPPEEHPERFKEIRNAYELLKSPEKRSAVDMFLFQPPPEPPEIKKGRYDLTVHLEDMIRLAVEFKLAELNISRDFRDPEV